MPRRPCRSVICLQAYLAALGEPTVTKSLLRRFRDATNMTDEISALAVLDRAGEGRWMAGMDRCKGGWHGTNTAY